MSSLDVCVIGAGIIGLSAALNIQKLIRLVNVTVIADAIGQETNTPVVRSLFIPAPFDLKDVEPTVARGWFADGWDHHFALATSPDSAQSGNRLQYGTCLWWHDGDHVCQNYVWNYRRMTREEMDEKEYNYAYGCQFTTVNVDVDFYLRWLLKEIRRNGGKIIYDTVFSLQQLYGQYDVVVNCVGRRGRELKADENLHYVKGNMLQTTPIDNDRFLITQDHVYICPNARAELCDVGFIWENNNQSSVVDEDTEWLIHNTAINFVPELKDCKVVKSLCEKRAERTPILLETELLDCGGPILPIVHNIGHGENTVSLAWGRGVHAAHLVQEVQRITRPFARKWTPFNKL